jgi:hypothetical protein
MFLDIYNVNTVLHILAPIFNWTYLSLILEICRQFSATYTANMVPIQRITSSLRYVNCGPDHIQCIYSSAYSVRQYSTERICAAIADISTTQCMLYYKLGAKYSAHPPVFAMWTVIPDIYNVFTAPRIQSSIFNWTHLRCNWRYLDNSMRVILQAWCQIQRTPSSLPYVICGPGYMQCN